MRAVLGFVIVFGAASAHAHPPDKVVVRDVTLRLKHSYHHGAQNCTIKFFRGRTLLYSKTADGELCWIGTDPDATDPSPPPGEDLLGTGRPTFVVTLYSGAAHCCATILVWELDDKLNLAGEIDVDGVTSPFERRNGRWVLLTNEGVFDYWKTCHADSAFPKVILRFDHGQFRPALDLMQTPDPNLDVLSAEIQAKWPTDEKMEDPQRSWSKGVPPILWSHMLELIYGGHAPDARKLFDLAWPKGTPGKDEFAAEFRAQLAKSRWWPAIRAWNGGF